MDITLIRLIFTLQLEENIADTHAFFGIRSCFKEVFRARHGCTSEADEACSRQGEPCPYHSVFSQPLSVDPTALKRFQKPPLPFVLDIPSLPSFPNSGHTLELGLTLAGSASHLVSEFCETVQAMVTSHLFRRIAPVSVVKVDSAGYGKNRTALNVGGKGFAGDRITTLSLQGLQETSVLPPDSLTLTILTPMRIMAEGRALRELSFSSFIRALLRRISSIAYYYAGCEESLDYKWLAEQSRLVQSTEYDLSWEEWGTRMSGLTGRITFIGDLMEYHPFLLAGEYLHIGKGATFGLGRYVLEEPDRL